MHFWPRSAYRARATAAVLVLGVHALALLVMLTENRGDPRTPVPARQLEGIWIRLPPLEPPLRPADKPESSLAPLPDTAVTPDDLRSGFPSTAITLVPEGQRPAQSSLSEGPVNWLAEAGKLTSGFGEDDAPSTFGPPVEKMREPCKPGKRSFKWKSEQKSTGSAGLTLGWEKQDPDKHFFDDMKSRDRRVSSVPDPNVCD